MCSKELGYGHAGLRFQGLVEVDKIVTQMRCQLAAPGGFAATHKTNEENQFHAAKLVKHLLFFTMSHDL